MNLIRRPVAQHFYSGDCQGQLDKFLTGFQIPPDLPADLIGAVVPHAGWQCSGEVAAQTLYCLAQRSQPASCILFGADHTGVWQNSLYPEGIWETPLGPVDIDEEWASVLLREIPDLITSNPEAHNREHSIEVLVPMVKYLWPDITIVPVIVPPGDNSILLGVEIGKRAHAIDRQTIFLASTDLTHYGQVYGLNPAGSGYHGFEWIVKNDKRMLECLTAVDGKAVLTEAREHMNACGSGAVAALMGVMVELGHDTGYLVKYTTSHGQAPPADFKYGVGYVGIVY